MGFLSLKGVCDCCGKEYGFNKYMYKDGIVCPECNKKVIKRLKRSVGKTTIAEVKEIMDTFGDKVDKCDCCGNKIGTLVYKCSDAVLCGNCATIGSKNVNKPLKKTTLAEILPFADAEKMYKEHLDEFVPTKKIGSYLEVDEEKGEWLVPDGFFGGKKHPKIFRFEDIVNYELLVDESTITSGGVGRAIAGDILFGATGAIVGGVTGKKRAKKVVNSMKIKITVNNLQYPTVYIKFFNSETKVDSMMYRSFEKSAQECLSVLDLLVNRFAKAEKEVSQVNNKDFMFCKECGNKIPRDSKFCAECGSPQ